MRAWSADGKQFYVTSTWGSLIPFDFDPTSGKATPKAKDLRGVSGEPDFHPLEAGVIICPHQTDYQIWRRNINTGEELALFNLQGVATFDLGNPRTYVGGCGINQLGNRVFAFFGGG
jgi:sugar lactone lactonase YvrE